jgi:hypothetical protein
MNIKRKNIKHPKKTQEILFFKIDKLHTKK